jgi:uncharacterized protein YegJ (DUF2314 family)
MQKTMILLVCVVLFACTEKPVQIPTPTPLPTTQLSSDPELGAAFDEARATLEVFLQKIGTPRSDRTRAAVKVRFFPPGDLAQDIWVDGVTYADGSIRGTMGDDIPSLKLSIGDKITIAKKDVVDWMVVENGKLIGGYTIRLAYKRMSPEEKKRFLSVIDYSIEN